MATRRNPASSHAIFADRSAAGRRLAAALRHYREPPPVVLAVPRGGVPVGYEIAKALGVSLDLLFVRKLRAPDGPEFGLGAVADCADQQCFLDQEFIDRWHVEADYIDSEIRVQSEILAAWKRRLLGDRLPLALTDRTVILVDEGIVTGSTIRAALMALDQAGVGRKVLAVPVAPQSLLPALASTVDELVCLRGVSDGQPLGFYYADFPLTTDDEVVELLRKAGSPVSGAVPGRAFRPAT